MTKLVLALAVVVVVILVVVIVAVKNMRAEDPDEFSSQDERDIRYDRRRPDRQPVRASRGAGPAGRAAVGRQARSESRSGGAGRGPGERRDQQRGGGYGHHVPEDQGYDADQGYDQRAAGAYDDLRSAPVPTGQERRRRSDNGTGHRSDGAPARARSARGRRSEDSSEWDSSEWEKLSDVDYWAELASDKPLTTTAQPAAPHSAAPRNGTQRRSGQDRETEALAVGGPVPGAPRRDPATGLPVRGPQQPADADLAAAASRNDFAAAPVPVDRAQDRPRPATGPNRERRGQDSQRSVASANGDRGTRSPRPRAASTGERRLPDRQRPPAAPVSESEQRSLAALMGEPSTYLSAGPASLPMPAIRDVPPDRPRDVAPDRPRDVPRDRPRLAPDDDPLTSPSFPKIPAADSRSYHSGRTDTPAGGSHVQSPYPTSTPANGSRTQSPYPTNTPANGSRTQSPYPAATRQFAAYDAPAAPYPSAQRPERPAAHYPAAQYPSAEHPELPAGQYSAAPYPSAQQAERPAAQYPAAQYPAPEQPAARHRGNGNGGVEADRSNPYAYRPDPLTSPGPYPAGASASPAASSMPPGPAPVPPAAGNPYGSYVTPDSQPTMASSYDSYAAMPGNGHGQSYQPPAVPGDTGQNGNGYWHQQPSPPASSSDRGNASYPGSAAQVPNADAQTGGYQNGYGQQGQAGYPPSSYPTSQNDPAGYPSVDPYGSDGYGGYPGYGAAER
jgi:hypothetical protein